MSKPKYGELQPMEEHRDAVHVPIVRVTARDIISPGDPISLEKQDSGEIYAIPYSGEASGGVIDFHRATIVADPFLECDVHPGQRFYAWMRPDSTKKLWHQWTHRLID